MGQKVNPISLRLEKTNRHFDSCWYDDYNYTDLLLQDLKIKNYLKTVLNQISYPEGRLLIENLPKKTNINLFYYNPTNSRRKKNIRFQLQNFKENKIKEYTYKDKTKGFAEKNKDSFFSFPEQTYWTDKKSGAFTLAQQGIEGIQGLEEWKNGPSNLDFYNKNIVSLKKKGQDVTLLNEKKTSQLRDTKKPLHSLSDLFLSFQQSIPCIPSKTQVTKKEEIERKENQKKGYTEGLQGVSFYTKTKEFPSKIKEIKNIKSLYLNEKDSKSKTDLSLISPLSLVKAKNTKNICLKGYKEQGIEEHYYQTKSLSLNFPYFFHPFHNTLSYKDKKYKVENNINGKILEFVLSRQGIRRNKLVEKRDIGKKWIVERFFVRYLLAQFYCKFLQNKALYNQESVYTLYKFHMFFQENSRNSLTDKGDIRDTSISAKQINKIKIPERIKTTKNNKHFPSGLYSSNRVYKYHLESFLSKQYQTFFNINFFRSLTEKQGAFFLVQEIIYYLERKMPFRRIKTQILREIPHYKRIKGIRITCSGRVGGRSKKAQRSKTQSVKIGQTSLGVFSSKIDFACKSAYTRFGLIGVKVWICYQ